jgi:AcrR family transcriptional regulator
VGRWAEDANGRLRAAAMQLYVERGFEETTVAEIAARAGVTARTFFRHFADKREVLFAGSSELQTHLVAALEAAAPAAAAPMQAVAAALDVAAELLGENRDFTRRRQAVINSHAELRERELIKLASLAAALADGLRRRGVPEPDASLAAESGIVVLRVAFERWTQPEAQPDADNSAQPEGRSNAGGEDRPGGQGGEDRPGGQGGEGQPGGQGGESLRQIMRESLDRLTTVTADRGQGSRSTPTA